VGYFRTVWYHSFLFWAAFRKSFTTGAQRDTEENLLKSTGENVVRIEALALSALADRIAGPMAAAFE
jgi:hypothetical protein